MADVYLYADETGNLDYAGAGKGGSSAYFGFGTVVFSGHHGDALMGGLRLRAELEAKGVQMPKGLHAVNDSDATRHEMFELVREQAPRIDTTFLLKANAYPRVRERGEMYLYQMAWYMHFKEIALQVSQPSDRLFVIVGTFGTRKRQAEARDALSRVCTEVGRHITLCVWDAASSWGLQVADYALWLTQRHLAGRNDYWYDRAVAPYLQSLFLPWGGMA